MDPLKNLDASKKKKGVGHNRGFAVSSSLKFHPKKIGLKPETSPRGQYATCQSLGARFSHVTFGSYGGPRTKKK